MGITEIDWGNSGFLRTYTMAFGASVVLTVVLWLVAVAKRAIQGVPPLQALGESIGYLLMSVMASAFAPLGIAYITQIFDGISEAMLAPVADDLPKIGAVLLTTIGILMAIPGGPVICLAIGFFLLMAILGVWLELIVRNALIYTGLVFGPTVFAGLVDKDLWGHTKRWLGVIVGVIASKYITFTTLALASALFAGHSSENASVAQAFGTLLTALALFFLALYLPFQVAKFFPILGDQVQDVYNSRKQMEGGLSNLGQTAKSSFGDIKSKLGGGSEGGDDEEGADGGEIDSAVAGDGAAPGIGLAKAAQEQGEQEVEGAAMRGVDGATSVSEQEGGQGSGPGTAGNTASAPEQGQEVEDLQPDGQAHADPAASPQGADAQQDPSEGSGRGDSPAGSGHPVASDDGAAARGAVAGPGNVGVGASPTGADAALQATSGGASPEAFSDGSPVEEPPDDEGE
ncbi:hypothetical protein ACFVYP_36780 [Kitasatospora sp. NPDC058201]|uniref:hypothetical protein n=1 Tax=unclassified Kitasatospora TaxID=2633591 RepID=UPI00364B4644